MEESSGLSQARADLVKALAGSREKVRDSTGGKLRQSWLAPMVAGAAGLALALLLTGRRRKRVRTERGLGG